MFYISSLTYKDMLKAILEAAEIRLKISNEAQRESARI
jgi:D-alanine-D-alanine ligase